MCCDRGLRITAPFPPPPLDRAHHVTLHPSPASARLARRFVREHVAGVEPTVADTAQLVVSELVTNAVIHARTPIEVGIAIGEEAILVAVGDRDLMAPERLPYTDSRPGGRGLALVRDLSLEWGTATYVGGKTVWALLPRSRAADGAHHG